MSVGVNGLGWNVVKVSGLVAEWATQPLKVSAMSNVLSRIGAKKLQLFALRMDKILSRCGEAGFAEVRLSLSISGYT
jgi:hypothetical protein